MAGQYQPNAMVTNITESRGHENRLEMVIRFLNENFRYLYKAQSTASDTMKAVQEAIATFWLRKKVIKTANPIQNQHAQSPHLR